MFVEFREVMRGKIEEIWKNSKCNVSAQWGLLLWIVQKWFVRFMSERAAWQLLLDWIQAAPRGDYMQGSAARGHAF